MSLEDFESLALANNPTICQLAATTQKAAGFRTQVGLRANPIVGYQGTQLAEQGTDQHTAFVQQEIVTGGKLDLNRRVLNEALRAQLLEVEAQKLRVSTDIRIRFFEALASQRRIDTSSVAVTKYATEILPSAQESLVLAEQAYKGGETSFVQVLIARRTYFDANLQYVAAQSQHAQAKSKVDGLVLTGGLDAVIDNSGDDGLRGLTFSQQ